MRKGSGGKNAVAFRRKYDGKLARKITQKIAQEEVQKDNARGSAKR